MGEGRGWKYRTGVVDRLWKVPEKGSEDERTGGGVAAGESRDSSPGVAMDVYHKPCQILREVAGTSTNYSRLNI